MNWTLALALIQQGKRVRAIDWAPGNYCELRDDVRSDIINAKRYDPLRKWMPFEFIVGRGPEVIDSTFTVHTGDTIGEWELYNGI